MVRLSAIYVAFCMVLIAVSIGVVLFLGVGLTWAEAAIVAIAALTAMALYDAVAKELRSRAVVSDQIANLSRGTADLAWQVADLTRQVGELSRRLQASERKTDTTADQARTAIPSFIAEIDELGTIVQQLAETVAVHDTSIAEQYALIGEPERENFSFVQNPAPTSTPATEAALQMGRDPFSVGAAGTAPPTESRPAPKIADDEPKATSPEEMIAAVRGALENNRADLYLQPIVSLPQRKVRYYETFTRLRDEDGSLILPAAFLAAAESGGLMPRIDHLVQVRAAQVVRWLLNKNRDIGLTCNVATSTLTNPASQQQLLNFFNDNQELASAIVLEFPQTFWRANSPLAQPGLAALKKLGVRFSMDRVTDLHMEPRELADRGIRLVKVPAKLLLTNSNALAHDIHPADLSDLMARYGIGLIAERIEGEETVLDLLEFAVRFGQGYLFSPPRPLRAETVRTVTEEAPTAQPEDAGKTREPASSRQIFANAVEDFRRTGILPQPAPGGSRA